MGLPVVTVAAFAACLLAQLGLLAWSFRFPKPESLRPWLLRLLLLSMAYDNLVLALGGVGGVSSWYAGATWLRFALHALVLPLLIPFALSAMRVCGAPLARRRSFAVFCWLCVGAAWCYGLGHDLLGLELAPKEVLGHARLASVSAQPPLATIAVNLLFLGLAASVWRRAGWSAAFLGGLFILVVNGAVGARPWGLLAGNGAELAFVFSLLLPERFLGRLRADGSGASVSSGLPHEVGRSGAPGGAAKPVGSLG